MTTTMRPDLPPMEYLLTKKDALRAEYVDTEDQYDTVRRLAEGTRQYHAPLGTLWGQMEPPPMIVEAIAKPGRDSAERALAYELEDGADPLIDELRNQLLPDARYLIDTCERWNRTIKTKESGTVRSIHEAIAKVDELSDTINRENAAGLRIHRRTPLWFRRMVRFVPYIEVIGGAVFMAYFMNVDFLSPGKDLLSWTAAVAIVFVLAFFQSRKVHQAAIDHNHAREQDARGHREAAQTSTSNRDHNLTLAGIATAIITAMLALRATASVDFGMPLLVILTAAITTGIALPILAFVAVAFDGSSTSRERDELIGLLDEDEADFKTHLEDASDALDTARSQHEQLTQTVLKAICNQAEAEFYDARREYALLRILLGLPTRGQDDRVDSSNRIRTGIPGAAPVDHRPLQDREITLQYLEGNREGLNDRLTKIPDHPWTRLAQQHNSAGTAA